MYTSNARVAPKDDTMVLKNSLSRIRQLDAYKASRVINELKISCSRYKKEDMMGDKVIAFDYNHNPTIPNQKVQCWCKIIDIFPAHNLRDSVPLTIKSTSPKLHKRHMLD